ncbi:hypothetical protein [Nocardioides sp.]|uniref:hypothetical protein n=1 Tax=Nocardioides sp. TaxID=35761 RepID=UPI00260400A3|nr:hypothetical protein [Nocardioides sp.]
MASWFRRARNAVADQVQQAPDPDSPEVLASALTDLIRLINSSAGRLPVAAVVAARHVTDVVDDILDSIADDVTPDIQAVISVRGIVYDYLPTTLHRYLALDPASTSEVLAHGRTPAEQVTEQLDDLWQAATDVLEATRARDADALVAQGTFLRTKFTRSDLDL